jgi:hypothetical protein
MISSRRSIIVSLALIALPTVALEVFSGGIDQPADTGSRLLREQAAPAGPPSVGVQEVPRSDGGRDLIYYSVSPPEEKQARRQAEINQKEKSLELLNSAIIIKR